jgi:hypothetical protein
VHIGIGKSKENESDNEEVPVAGQNTLTKRNCTTRFQRVQ